MSANLMNTPTDDQVRVALDAFHQTLNAGNYRLRAHVPMRAALTAFLASLGDEPAAYIVTNIHGEKIGKTHNTRRDALAYVAELQANRALKQLSPGNYNIESLFRNPPPARSVIDLEQFRDAVLVAAPMIGRTEQKRLIALIEQHGASHE